jgi:SAM-dependent methyltransferase
MDDERELVRRGYDELSYRYRPDGAGDDRYTVWLAELDALLPRAATVLDLGCGCGVPAARFLADAGHRVTGVDFSAVQVTRARRLVPGAVFVECDAIDLHVEPASLDAVVCLYTLIHLPLRHQPGLIRRIATWLRPGGWLLATTGQDAWTGCEDGWLGGAAPMWWSHAAAPTYRRWFEAAGLTVTSQTFVPEGGSGHARFLARNVSNI